MYYLVDHALGEIDRDFEVVPGPESLEEDAELLGPAQGEDGDQDLAAVVHAGLYLEQELPLPRALAVSETGGVGALGDQQVRLHSLDEGRAQVAVGARVEVPRVHHPYLPVLDRKHARPQHMSRVERLYLYTLLVIALLQIQTPNLLHAILDITLAINKQILALIISSIGIIACCCYICLLFYIIRFLLFLFLYKFYIDHYSAEIFQHVRNNSFSRGCH